MRRDEQSSARRPHDRNDPGSALAQEDPQRDERRIDPVEPDNIQCFQCLRHRTFRQYIREWQVAVLQELPSQKTHLLRETVPG